MKTTIYMLLCNALPEIALASGVGTAHTPAAWQACSLAEQIATIAATGVVSLFGLIIGWIVFPLTVAPIRYIMQSELEIWGARLAMAMGAGAFSGYFVFQFLVRNFSGS